MLQSEESLTAGCGGQEWNARAGQPAKIHRWCFPVLWHPSDMCRATPTKALGGSPVLRQGSCGFFIRGSSGSFRWPACTEAAQIRREGNPQLSWENFLLLQPKSGCTGRKVFWSACGLTYFIWDHSAIYLVSLLIVPMENRCFGTRSFWDVAFSEVRCLLCNLPLSPPLLLFPMKM